MNLKKMIVSTNLWKYVLNIFSVERGCKYFDWAAIKCLFIIVSFKDHVSSPPKNPRQKCRGFFK